MSGAIRLQWTSDAPDLSGLHAGDEVELNGRVFTLRDASAARLARAIDAGEPTPVPLAHQILYAVGPSPAKPGQIIGSAGPTTTERMGRYLPSLFAAGVRAVIGKGELHADALAAFTSAGAVYFAAIGGLGALLARHISAARVVAFDDLGPEALYSLDLEAFPVVTIVDTARRNFHDEARTRWRTAH